MANKIDVVRLAEKSQAAGEKLGDVTARVTSTVVCGSLAFCWGAVKAAGQAVADEYRKKFPPEDPEYPGA